MRKYIPSFNEFLNEAVAFSEVLKQIQKAQSAADTAVQQVANLKIQSIVNNRDNSKEIETVMNRVWTTLSGDTQFNISNIKQYIQQYLNTKVAENIYNNRQQLIKSGMSELQVQNMFNSKVEKQKLDDEMEKIRTIYSDTTDISKLEPPEGM